jgi:peptide/nickel transport system ATP-binding protein
MTSPGEGLSERGKAHEDTASTLLRASCISVASDMPGALVLEEAGFALDSGGSLGVAGESGSGKTTLAQSLFGYVRPGLRPVGGEITVEGEELKLVDSLSFIKMRGRLLTFVPQGASSMLNPIMSVGAHLSEICRTNGMAQKSAIEDRVSSLLRQVGFPDPVGILGKYPHELSGGQRQRVVLCMALIPEPHVLVMDEATTDLDVLTQLRILELIRDLKSRLDFGLVVVSHDLRVLAALCTDLLVMYAGQIVEQGPLKELLARPAHPYTAQLVERFSEGPLAVELAEHESKQSLEGREGCLFRLQCPMAQSRCAETPALVSIGEARASRCWFAADVKLRTSADSESTPPVDSRRDLADHSQLLVSSEGASQMQGSLENAADFVAVRDLTATHRGPGLFIRQRVEVLHGISFAIPGGETLGIVGESGSGKTTLARILAGLHPPDTGEVRYGAFDLSVPARRRPLAVRREIQIVFQNPETALNPRVRVGDVLLRRIRLFEDLDRSAGRARVGELLASVGLPEEYATRRPGALSGGEKQRVAIARSLIGGPRLLICDEVLSSLDVINQAKIIQLLVRLQETHQLTMIFISHDIGVTAAIATRILVFKDGDIREQGRTSDILLRPSDEYTARLIASAKVNITSSPAQASLEAH